MPETITTSTSETVVTVTPQKFVMPTEFCIHVPAYTGMVQTHHIATQEEIDEFIAKMEKNGITDEKNILGLFLNTFRTEISEELASYEVISNRMQISKEWPN